MERPGNVDISTQLVSLLVNNMRRLAGSRNQISSNAQPFKVIHNNILSAQKTGVDKDIDDLHERSVKMIENLSKCQANEKDFFRLTVDRYVDVSQNLVESCNKNNKQKYRQVRDKYCVEYNQHLDWLTRNKDKESHFHNFIFSFRFDEWSDQQLDVVLNKYSFFDPKLYIDGSTAFQQKLQQLCPYYRANEIDRVKCDCFSQTSFHNKNSLPISPIVIALINNKSRFLEELSLGAKNNNHLRWLIYNWLLIGRKSTEQIWEAAFTYVSEVCNISDSIRVLIDPKYCYLGYMSLEECKTEKGRKSTMIPYYNIQVKHPGYTAKYYENFISMCITAGFYDIAKHLIKISEDKMPLRLFPAIMVSIFLLEDRNLVNNFLSAIFEAVVHSCFHCNLEDILIGDHNFFADSFLHIIIDKGSVQKFDMAVNFIQMLCNRLNQEFDYSAVINIDRMNLLQYAIIQNEQKIIQYIINRKIINVHEQISKVAEEHSSIINGYPDIRSFINRFKLQYDHFGHLSVLSLMISTEKDDLAYEVLKFYMNEINNYSIIDINLALTYALYPRRRFAEIHSSGQARMHNIVAMLLMAGASIEQIQSDARWDWLPDNIPPEIFNFVRYVQTARKKRFFGRKICSSIAVAWDEARRYFRHKAEQ